MFARLGLVQFQGAERPHVGLRTGCVLCLLLVSEVGWAQTTINQNVQIGPGNSLVGPVAITPGVGGSQTTVEVLPEGSISGAVELDADSRLLLSGGMVGGTALPGSLARDRSEVVVSQGTVLGPFSLQDQARFTLEQGSAERVFADGQSAVELRGGVLSGSNDDYGLEVAGSANLRVEGQVTTKGLYFHSAGYLDWNGGAIHGGFAADIAAPMQFRNVDLSGAAQGWIRASDSSASVALSGVIGTPGKLEVSAGPISIEKSSIPNIVLYPKGEAASITLRDNDIQLMVLRAPDTRVDLVSDGGRWADAASSRSLWIYGDDVRMSVPEGGERPQVEKGRLEGNVTVSGWTFDALHMATGQIEFDTGSSAKSLVVDQYGRGALRGGTVLDSIHIGPRGTLGVFGTDLQLDGGRLTGKLADGSAIDVPVSIEDQGRVALNELPDSFLTEMHFNPANGHFYQMLTGEFGAPLDGTWQAALDAAAARSMGPIPGHLVTITSAEEEAFVVDTFVPTNQFWLGASDAAVEGEWRWVAGPESGQLFWKGDSNGTGSGYAHWSPNQPGSGWASPQAEDYVLWDNNNLAWHDYDGKWDKAWAIVEYSALSGDADGDGVVSLEDFGVLKNHFGGAATFANGDFNGDHHIDLSDFGLLKQNFGQASVAPEPPAFWLSVVGAVAGLLHCGLGRLGRWRRSGDNR